MRLILALILLSVTCKSQVVIGGLVADQSAILELRSMNKGMLIPRLNTIQRNSVVASEGMMIYNTDENCVEYYIGSEWLNMCKSNAVISDVRCINDTTTYQQGMTKDIYVDVVSAGNYYITTTSNGITFIGRGFFVNKGNNKLVTLKSFGTPTNVGNYSYNIIEGSCSFVIKN